MVGYNKFKYHGREILEYKHTIFYAIYSFVGDYNMANLEGGGETKKKSY